MLLTAVRLVCEAFAIALRHVMQAIDNFMQTGAIHRTLRSDSERGSPSLLDRLLEHEWSGFDPMYRELRLWQAIKETTKHKHDVQVIKWWLRSYMPHQEAVSMYALYRLMLSTDSPFTIGTFGYWNGSIAYYLKNRHLFTAIA